MDTDQAERDARELTTAFQHALSNNNTNVNDDAMDVDSDTYNCEGEGEDGDEVVSVDPQVQSAKEWVCVRTYGMYYHYQPYATSYQVDNYILNSRRKSGRETEQSVLRLWKVS